MKNRQSFIRALLLKFVILFCSFNTSAQSWCGAPKNQFTSAAQPSTCSRQLLDDFVPTSNDRTIDVNVNFWIFVPVYMSSLTSVWTHSLNPTTSVSAQACLDAANLLFLNIPATPKLSTGMPVGTPYAKINLVLKNFTYVYNDLPYLSVGNAVIGNFGMSWHDPNAVNVFVGTETMTNVATSPSGTYIASTYLTGQSIGADGIPGIPGVSNVIHFNPEFFFTILPDGSRYDNIASYGEA